MHSDLDGAGHRFLVLPLKTNRLDLCLENADVVRRSEGHTVIVNVLAESSTSLQYHALPHEGVFARPFSVQLSGVPIHK